ncbi:Ni/Fe hydrogenase subunit alpha [Propionivibrio sp.]|uniref:Ni/Fe hydrogenase subunit alpha n=1 Tax=Propionivibrio sp. TaxID=2212460 RepID=UPI0025D48474|nr:Ni/Fe hydrogenase subunit alpha [Propionivibrio sp.]
MSFELETATADASTLRRVAIDPVSRVEGHGKVTLLLDENDIVQQVRLHIVEFRGFEKFIQGRPYWEVPVMVQRLCGICPVSHHLAASKALDHVVGAPRLTPAAEKLRRLDALRPDPAVARAAFLPPLVARSSLRFRKSEVGKRNIVGVAAAYPEVAKQGVLLRKFGQEVIRLTAGKRIHGTGAQFPAASIGRSRVKSATACWLMSTRPSPGAVTRCIWSGDCIMPTRGCTTNSAASVRTFFDRRRQRRELDFYDGTLRVRDADGQIIVDGVDVQNYQQLIREEVKPWSYMKFPYLGFLGPDEGWYKVGPLARVQNCDFIPSPLAEDERRTFVDYGKGGLIQAPLAYHWARMIEMRHAAETIKDLLNDDDISGSELMASGAHRREGIGVIEAPRGTLLHHYQVNDDDLVTMCNLIVSTTHNNQPMNEAVRRVAKRYLSGRKLTEGLLNHIEVAIRAFDPCLSCATHALGKMPLQVTLLDAEGRELDRRCTSADGGY